MRKNKVKKVPAAKEEKTVFYRHIVELSPMINNDEVVIYMTECITNIDEMKKVVRFRESAFSTPTIVIARPIFEEEKDVLLSLALKHNLVYRLTDHCQEESRTTHFLDCIYRFKDRIDFVKMYTTMKDNFDASRFLAMEIGLNYFDCMSSGCPRDLFLLYQTMLRVNPNIDLTTEVYPIGSYQKEKYGNRDWYTLQDFKEMVNEEELADFLKMFSTYQGRLALL